jgi:glycosyltransferase involved in cell wall biosynthesis
MNKLDLTIIIPCASDARIKDCIQSIYETCPGDIEVLVSLNNASKKVRDILKNFKNIKTCEIKEPNLSKSYNNGIGHASRNNILLMDSDCIFAPKAIELLYEGLKYAELSKGLVIFQTNNLMSKVIGRVREYTTTDFVSAYVPPLAFSKAVKNLIGGYYFNEKMLWSGDGEFDYRIQQAGLKIYYNPKAVIYHTSLSFFHDIKSGFRYGKGRRVGVDLNLLPKRNYFKIATHLERFIRTYEILYKKGLLAALYYFFIWRPVYRLGYIIQAFYNIL